MSQALAVSHEEPASGDGFALVFLWRRWLASQNLSENTIRLYTSGVTRLFIEIVGGPVRMVTEDHVATLLELVSDKYPAKVQYLRGIRSFCVWAVRRGEMAADPTEGFRMRKPQARAGVCLTEEELTRLFVAAAWRDPKRAWAMVLCYALGTRRSELCGIAPRDVEGDTVVIRRGKGRKQRRVELGPLAQVALEELRPWWTEESVVGGCVPQTFTEWAHDAAAAAGLQERVSRRPAHVLRASFATHLLRNGTPIEVVRDLLGHTNIQTTNVYAVSDESERRAAVRTLPGM